MHDAQEDLRAAIRFVRSKAAEYRIDTDRIIASGSSAGAFATLFMAYAQNAEEGESGNPGYSSKPNGVLSFSGVLKEELMCRLEDGLPAHCFVNTGNDNTSDVGAVPGHPPMTLLHGTTDTVTPYVNGLAIH